MTARIRGDAEALVALENEYGSRYLDCLSAYSAVNHGHRHPNILAATHEQAARVTLTFRACRTEQLAPFCQKLAQFCGMDTVFPMNTGAETVETAIEAAITPNSCAVLLEPISVRSRHSHSASGGTWRSRSRPACAVTQIRHACEELSRWRARSRRLPPSDIAGTLAAVHGTFTSVATRFGER